MKEYAHWYIRTSNRESGFLRVCAPLDSVIGLLSPILPKAQTDTHSAKEVQT